MNNTAKLFCRAAAGFTAILMTASSLAFAKVTRFQTLSMDHITTSEGTYYTPFPVYGIRAADSQKFKMQWAIIKITPLL